MTGTVSSRLRALLLQLGLEAGDLGLEEGCCLGGVLRRDQLGLELRHVRAELLHLLAAPTALRRRSRPALQLGDAGGQRLALALLLHVRGLRLHRLPVGVDQLLANLLQGHRVGAQALHLVGQLAHSRLGPTGQLRVQLVAQRGRLLRLGLQRVLELLHLGGDLRYLGLRLLLGGPRALHVPRRRLELLLHALPPLLLAAQRRLELRRLLPVRLQRGARLLVGALVLLELSTQIGTLRLRLGALLDLRLQLTLQRLHPLAARLAFLLRGRVRLLRRLELLGALGELHLERLPGLSLASERLVQLGAGPLLLGLHLRLDRLELAPERRRLLALAVDRVLELRGVPRALLELGLELAHLPQLRLEGVAEPREIRRLLLQICFLRLERGQRGARLRQLLARGLGHLRRALLQRLSPLPGLVELSLEVPGAPLEVAQAAAALPLLHLEVGQGSPGAAEVGAQLVRFGGDRPHLRAEMLLLADGRVALGGQGPRLLGHPLEVLFQLVRDGGHLLVLAVDRVEAAHRLQLLHLELARLLLRVVEGLLAVRHLLGEGGAGKLLVLEPRPQTGE